MVLREDMVFKKLFFYKMSYNYLKYSIKLFKELFKSNLQAKKLHFENETHDWKYKIMTTINLEFILFLFELLKFEKKLMESMW